MAIEKIKLSLSGTNAEHDAFVDANPPNARCPLDSFLRKILNSAHGGVVNNDLRAHPVITYSVNGKYVAWFDASEDHGYIQK